MKYSETIYKYILFIFIKSLYLLSHINKLFRMGFPHNKNLLKDYHKFLALIRHS